MREARRAELGSDDEDPTVIRTADPTATGAHDLGALVLLGQGTKLGDHRVSSDLDDVRRWRDGSARSVEEGGGLVASDPRDVRPALGDPRPPRLVFGRRQVQGLGVIDDIGREACLGQPGDAGWIGVDGRRRSQPRSAFGRPSQLDCGSLSLSNEDLDRLGCQEDRPSLDAPDHDRPTAARAAAAARGRRVHHRGAIRTSLQHDLGGSRAGPRRLIDRSARRAPSNRRGRAPPASGRNAGRRGREIPRRWSPPNAVPVSASVLREPRTGHAR